MIYINNDDILRVSSLDYIEKILGEPVIRKKWQGIDKMPYYLHSAYKFEQVAIGTQKCLIITPQNELGTISVIKKNINRIKSEWDNPIVLEVQNLSRQRNETLIKEKIPFIVREKQLYLPFMGVALREKHDKEKFIGFDKLSPWRPTSARFPVLPGSCIPAARGAGRYVCRWSVH